MNDQKGVVMKKLLMVSLFVNAALLLGWFRQEFSPVAAAGGGAGVPEEFLCYDANGDGSLDFSDPITLLKWLFLGNATPEVCPSGGGFVGLPDTGQTGCYHLGNCGSETCAGQDGAYRTGCPSEGRFVDNEDGTVTDNCTGLMWQQDTADVNGDGESNASDVAIWRDALAYGENLGFAGHEDWRLPNVRELQSIVDYGRFGPAIDPVFADASEQFGVGQAYWSSTPGSLDISGPCRSWVVRFTLGFVDTADLPSRPEHLVRAVRTAQ